MDGGVWMGAIFLGFAIGLGSWTLIDAIIAAVKGSETRDEVFVETRAFRILLPFVQVVARRLEPIRALDKMRDQLEVRLTMAGKRDAITPDEIMGTSVVCALLGFSVLVYAQLILEASSDIYVSGAFIPLLAAFLPIMGLNDMITKRHHKIRRALPYTLDLLTLSVEAGLDFTAALTRIADKLKGNPFQDEVRKLTRDLAMGKTRIEALKDMSERVRMEDLQSVVSALVQADELGSSLGPTLRIQASELRRRRFQLAEKKAMQAPVKMLFPLVAFIFPQVWLVVFGPLVIKFLTEKPL